LGSREYVILVHPHLIRWAFVTKVAILVEKVLADLKGLFE
jgi:hypothetical protein